MKLKKRSLMDVVDNNIWLYEYHEEKHDVRACSCRVIQDIIIHDNLMDLTRIIRGLWVLINTL